MSLPDEGRWFVYASFDTADATVETWLPVEVNDGTERSATRVLYEPPTSPDRAAQALAGAVLTAIAAVLLLGTLRAVAVDRPPPATKPVAGLP